MTDDRSEGDDRAAAQRFVSGPYQGQPKREVVREHLREFIEEAARIAVDMEQGTWVDPETGETWSTGRLSRTRISRHMGFSDDRRSLPSFLEEPRFSRAVQWERLKREANMRHSAQSIKPVVTVAASGMVMELLNRVLNDPESIGDRELMTETRKYVEMLVAWDAGTPDKPHIRNTILLLQQNIQGLPDASRAKVMQLVGNEIDHAVDVMKKLRSGLN